MILKIHVNQHNIRANAKAVTKEDFLPVISLKTIEENIYGNTAEILDNDGRVIAKIVYRPHKPLPCGAKVWIEVRSRVRIRGKVYPD
jgi:hypothetical protein